MTAIDSLEDSPEDWLIALHAAVVADHDSGLTPPADSIPPEEFAAVRDCLKLVERVRRARLSGDPTPAMFSQATLATAEHDSAPRRIGRFEVIRDLGRGGHGVVFLARDPALNRQVALKVPRPEMLLAPEMRRRFLREAQAAARLSHPYIVTVHEVGQGPPICYIASDYCPGDSLHGYLRSLSAPLSPRVAANLCAELATAVQYAHDHGVLHRDIKPSNVLLSRRPTGKGQGEEAADGFAFVPKLTDFGLARLSQYDAEQTRTGVLLGTPAYMAPEQAQGRASDIGPATDVYGLGAVLYEMLTGRPPFRGATDLDTLHQVLNSDPVRPSRLRPGVPADLEAICLCALEKDPRRRYSSALTMSDDLHRYLAGQATLIRPLSHIARIGKFCKRRPAIAVLAAVCFVAALTIVSGTLIYHQLLRTALAEAREQSQLRQSMLYASEVRLAHAAHDAEHLQERDELLQRHLPQDKEQDLREFAWHQLSQQAPPCVLTLRGHFGDVYGVAFSPDGKLLATAGKDATVRLWNVTSGREVGTLVGHQDEVGQLAFLDSGRLLATSGDEGKVYLWDVASRRLLRVIEAPSVKVNAICACSGDTRLACGGSDGRLRLWDGASGELLWTSDARGPVEAVSFSPDGSEIVTAGRWVEMYSWDATTGKLLGDLHDNNGSSHVNLAHGMGGQLLVAADRYLATRAYDRSDTKERWEPRRIAAFSTRENTLHGLAISPLDNTIALGSGLGNIHLKRPEGSTDQVFVAHADRVWQVAWSPDGRLLASASRDGTVKVWGLDAATSRTFIYPRPQGSWDCFSVSPDGKRIATLTRTGRVQLWDRNRRSLLAAYHPLASGGYLAHAGSGEMVGIDASGKVRYWREINGQETRCSAEMPISEAFAASAGGNLAASRCNRQEVSLLDLRRFKTLAYWPMAADVVRLAMAADGSRVAIATTAQQIEIWRVGSRKKERVLNVSDDRFAFSADNRQLITCRDDAPISLWNLADGTVTRKLSSNRGRLQAMTCSHDGRTMATFIVGGSSVMELSLWSLETGELLSSLEVPRGLRQIEFTPDDQTLIAMGEDRVSGWLAEWSCDIRQPPQMFFQEKAFVRQPLDQIAVQPLPALIAVARAEDPEQELGNKRLVMQRAFECSHPRLVLDNFLRDGNLIVKSDGQPHTLLLDHPGIDSSSVQLTFPEFTHLTVDDKTLEKVVKSIDLYADANFSGEYEPEIDLQVGQGSPLKFKRGFTTVALNTQASRDLVEKATGPDPRLNCGRLFRAVNDYAFRQGCSGGYPTFGETQNPRSKTVQIVLLRCPQARRLSLSSAQLEDAQATTLTDFNSQGDLLRSLLSASGGWASARGCVAALPTLYAVASGNQSPRYELTVYPDRNFKLREVPIEQLGHLDRLRVAFRLAHELAVAEGFASGYPTFRQMKTQAECVFVKTAVAEVCEVGLAEIYGEEE